MIYIKLALAAATLISSFFGGVYFNSFRSEAEIKSLKLQHEEALNKAMVNSAKSSDKLQKAKDAALLRAQKRAAASEKAAALATSQLDSLQSQLAESNSKLSTASCSSTRNYAATLSTVFNDCVGRYKEMGRKAQGHATDALTLRESFPTLEGPKNATEP